MKNQLRKFSRKLAPHRWKIAAALVLLYFVKWWWDGVQLIGPIPAPGPPKIVYLFCPVGAIWGRIYSMNLDGSEKTLLLSYPINKYDFRYNIHLEEPTIRPDRRKIAFYMRQNYQQSIWTMNMNGSRLKRITPWAGVAASPRFTADGHHIIFDYLYPQADDVPFDFYMMNSKGKQWGLIGNARDINSRTKVEHLLNPLGPWIVPKKMQSNLRPSPWRNVSIDHADGKSFPLPEIAARSFYFSLNPDRTQFVFTASTGSYPSPISQQIYKINSDGTGLVQLTNEPYNMREPKFTPDGQQIVFIRGDERHAKGENAEIYIMNADGTNQRQLTNTPQNEEWFDVR